MNLRLNIFICFIALCNLAIAQEDEVVIQVSGLVVTGDSLTPLPYATVYRSRDSRGTMTDGNGFFSLPALRAIPYNFQAQATLQDSL